MGCSSCPGGGGGQVAPELFQQETTAPPPSDNPNDYAIVEYVGGKQGGMSYRAPSGQVYRFSAATTERQKYVRAEDVDYFLMRQDFRVRKPEGDPRELIAAR